MRGSTSANLGAHELKDLPEPGPSVPAPGRAAGAGVPAAAHALEPASNLPPLPAPLIGRERELARLGSMLSDPRVRLVTVTGAGGAGKSRLALHAAVEQLGNFVDGVHLVRLAPVRESGRVPQAIAHTLGRTRAAGRAAPRDAGPLPAGTESAARA
jgi:hypothetical protein